MKNINIFASRKGSASGSSVENVNGFNTNENKNNNGDDVMKKMNKKEFKKLTKTGGYNIYSEIYDFATEMKIELAKAWELFEEANRNFEEAKKLAEKSKEEAEKGQGNVKEGQDILKKVKNRIDELSKEVEEYDNMATRFNKEEIGAENYQRIHGKEIPYAQKRVTELENKIRNGEGDKHEILTELKFARIDLKQKEQLYANAEEERRTSKTAARRALKESNTIRNGELRDAKNDLKTIKYIMAKY